MQSPRFRHSRPRRGHFSGFHDKRRSLMRHFLEKTLTITTLTRCVISAPGRAPLITTPGIAHLAATTSLAANQRAADLPPVTCPANATALPALHALKLTEAGANFALLRQLAFRSQKGRYCLSVVICPASGGALRRRRGPMPCAFATLADTLLFHPKLAVSPLPPGRFTQHDPSGPISHACRRCRHQPQSLRDSTWRKCQSENSTTTPTANTRSCSQIYALPNHR